MTHETLHNDFRLNGIHYNQVELKEVGYSLIKEGEVHERAIGDFLIDWLDHRATIEIATSGSTGPPKRILLQKQHMVNSAKATGDFFGLEPGSKALLCLPADFIAGKMILVRAMVLGLDLDYCAPSSNPLQLLKGSYDFCAMVPLQLKNSIAYFSRIKKIIVGGAPVSHGLRAKFPEQEKETQVFETYGMTETITHIAVKKIHPGGIKNESFKALPEVSFTTDGRGCLVIDAPNIAYDPVVTNDMVNQISDTEFEWLGRYDNVINSGGVKLFPEQIEKKLASQIDSRFFVAGLSDETLGQKLILIVEGDRELLGLLDRIRTSKLLDKFEIPKEVYGLPHFCETANHKVLRQETLGLILGIK